MKTLSKLSLVFLLLTGMAACEKEPEPSPNMREEYLGVWQVLESEGQFAPQSYSVEIIEGQSPDAIIIKGLYDYDSLSIKGRVDGYYMEIPLQQLLQFSFWGQGQANADFDQISIHFKVQDPIGIDSVKAILTR